MTETPISKSSHTNTKEFTILMALLISIVAFTIDAVLPALGDIGKHFNLANQNHAQYVIGLIFLGMAIGQLISGPISDAVGRKKIVYFGVGLYVLGSALCYFSTSFSLLLIGRFIQGLGVAGPYVCAVSIVRDRYSGRDMAKVMSIIMMVFIMAPAIAPSLGQAVLTFASWQYIFIMYIVYALIVSIWLALRLEETLPAEKRIPFQIKPILKGFREVFRNKVTISYTICMGICFGSFIGYLNSSQQIFQVQFNAGTMFNIYFGMLAIVLGIASLLNSLFVKKLGMRYICLRSVICIISVSAIFLAVNILIEPTLWMFLIYAGILFFCFGLMFGNLNAIALEPMGRIAGIASAITGSVSSIISMILGAVIGQLYNNTLFPLILGFLVLGIISLSIMIYANRISVNK